MRWRRSRGGGGPGGEKESGAEIRRESEGAKGEP